MPSLQSIHEKHDEFLKNTEQKSSDIFTLSLQVNLQAFHREQRVIPARVIPNHRPQLI